jgi:CHASE2 domain-containing sensor protein
MYVHEVKSKAVKLKPALITLGVIIFFSLIQATRVSLFERLEWITYDFRVQAASRFPAPAATNLGFVEIRDNTIHQLANGLLGRRIGLYWPRWVYGITSRELAAEGARAVALDVLFDGLRPDHARWVTLSRMIISAR